MITDTSDHKRKSQIVNSNATLLTFTPLSQSPIINECTKFKAVLTMCAQNQKLLDLVLNVYKRFKEGLSVKVHVCSCIVYCSWVMRFALHPPLWPPPGSGRVSFLGGPWIQLSPQVRLSLVRMPAFLFYVTQYRNLRRSVIYCQNETINVFSRFLETRIKI